jgi:hypothetical protein
MPWAVADAYMSESAGINAATVVLPLVGWQVMPNA